MFRSREPKGQEINDEKTVSQAVASVQDEETIGQQDRLQPAVADAFALREGDENQVDFKTLGWIKAGLIITCEVRCAVSQVLDCLAEGSRDRPSPSAPFPSPRRSSVWASLRA